MNDAKPSDARHEGSGPGDIGRDDGAPPGQGPRPSRGARSGQNTPPGQGAPPGQGDWAQVIGGNVRRLRAAAGISLADLAEAGGVSKTTLHGIEQGQGNPTMSTLWALATALHVPLGELLEGPGANVEITRAAGRRPQARGAAVGARLLHRIRLRGTVEVYDIDIAQASQHSDPHLPGVEECMVITRGRVATGPADAPATLAEGDSVRFGAALPHLYRGQDQHNRAVLLMLYPEA